jgi:hypothetical protein
MTKVFISYRRDDSADVTGRIFDHLATHFKEKIVFQDVNTIPLGQDFRDVIQKAVEGCQVLLAVIGPNWLTVKGEDGKRRLDNPTDFIRLEIEVALRRQIPVIPILVGKATMAKPDQLPLTLQPLAYRHGLQVRSDLDFRRDMDRLIEGIIKELDEKNPTTGEGGKKTRDSTELKYQENEANGTHTHQEGNWVGQLEDGQKSNLPGQSHHEVFWIMVGIVLGIAVTVFGVYADSRIVTSKGGLGHQETALKSLIPPPVEVVHRLEQEVRKAFENAKFSGKITRSDRWDLEAKDGSLNIIKLTLVPPKDEATNYWQVDIEALAFCSTKLKVWDQATPGIIGREYVPHYPICAAVMAITLRLEANNTTIMKNEITTLSSERFEISSQDSYSEVITNSVRKSILEKLPTAWKAIHPTPPEH